MTQDDAFPADTAERLQALLSGSLSPVEMRQVLALVARDGGARRMLDEMLALEHTVRAAYGYDRAEEKMRESLASLLASARAGEIPAEKDLARAARRPAFRLRRVLGALAASVVVAASLYAAISSHLLNRSMQSQLSQVPGSSALPKVTETERAEYSRIWSEVAQAAGGPKPWVLLSDGGGGAAPSCQMLCHHRRRRASPDDQPAGAGPEEPQAVAAGNRAPGRPAGGLRHRHERRLGNRRADGGQGFVRRRGRPGPRRFRQPVRGNRGASYRRQTDARRRASGAAGRGWLAGRSRAKGGEP